MKKNLFVLSLVCLLSFTFHLKTFAQQTFKTTTETVIGLLQYLPADYNSNSNKYPLVIFLHGIGERGANSTDPAVLESTIYSVDNLGPPYFAKNGYQFPFLMVSPQLKNNYGSWPIWYILEVINWAKSTLRVDEKRIHITGLSLGGGGVWTAIQDYPGLFASASPVCGGYNTPSKACAIAAENLPVWAFHGDSDTTVPLSRSVNMVNAINACVPAPTPKALMTIYPGVAHNAWDRAYKTDHSYHNPNVYEWMMTYANTRNAGNNLPTANAGADKSYSATTAISLSGSGTDSDGSISAYRWTKMSGPTASIANASAASTSVSVSAAGTYVFRLTVTDNGGQTDSDYVSVTVSSTSSSTASPNMAPVVQAGPDATLTLPSSTAILNGSATDSDGTIKSYSWTKLSGPSGNLSGATTSTLTAWKLVEGTYIFRLTVTDDDGATGYDDVKVVVNGSPTYNAAPAVTAGSDINLVLPSSTAFCTATASDSDGSIVSYQWTKVSGPAANMSGATTSTLQAWRLVEGSYVFRVTVKDDDGATAYDDVKVVVSGSNIAPTVSAGPDIRLVLPSTTAYCVGTASDSDGTIASYTWTKISGPAGNLSNTTSPTLTAWKLVEGTYVFRLTVKDDDGATAYDDVKVVVESIAN